MKTMMRTIVTARALKLASALWLGVLSIVAFSAWMAGEDLGDAAAAAGIAYLIGLPLALTLCAAVRIGMPDTRCPSWLLITGAILIAATLQIVLQAGLFALLWGTTAQNALAFPFYCCLFGATAAFFAITTLGDRIHTANLSSAGAEAAMLRLQLNPHVMVNALNAVASLILRGQHTKAAAMTDKLAQFLRLSLQMSEPFITLGDEMLTVETYLQAESIRFGDRLEIEIDYPDALEDVLVPNFILQPIVENAVKHGMSASVGTLILSIVAGEADGMLTISVTNNAIGGEDELPSLAGVGINNTRARLEALFGRRAFLAVAPTPDGYRGEIRLPLTAQAK